MNDDLLLKFLTKQCSDNELVKINKWISKIQNAKYLFEMEHLWSLKDELRFEKGTEVAFRNFISKRDAQSLHKSGTNFFIQKLPWYVAAVLAFISIFLAHNIINNKTHEEAFNVIEVPAGQVAKVILSDGSIVHLNASSKLTYPSKFAKNYRDVLLEGEAYFEVKGNKKSPFTVSLPELKIRVLGTKFNACSYINDTIQTVSLTEGKIEVLINNSEETVVLSPGEHISYSKNIGINKTINKNRNNTHRWISGELIFDNKRLDEIVPIIERRFNLKISIDNSILAAERFTCHIQANSNFIEVLNLLKNTRRLNYIMNENEIILTNSVKLMKQK